MFFSRLAFVALVAVSSVWSHPIARRSPELKLIGRDQSAILPRADANVLERLAAGNKAFREGINATADTSLLKKLADEGQAPPFMFLGCSDSRASETTIFNSEPGQLFTVRNIANQYHATDLASQSVLAYGTGELGVQHIIVMGHYGCGGVEAAILSKPASQDAGSGAVQQWIQSIREILSSSSRAELVDLRARISAKPIEELEIQDPGFRALVEENVKAGVARIAQDSVITNHYARLAGNGTAPAAPTRRSVEGAGTQDVFIHGWVYDIETGEIRDLGVSVGPPNKTIPPAPFALVAGAAEKVEGSHSSTVVESSTQEAAPPATATAGTPSEAAPAPAVTTPVVAEEKAVQTAESVPLLATSSAHHGSATTITLG